MPSTTRSQVSAQRALLLRLALSLAIAQCSYPVLAGDQEFIEVGSVPARCPITIKVSEAFHMPNGWKVTPEQAVTLAAGAGAGEMQQHLPAGSLC
jgi:hypothetical protein